MQRLAVAAAAAFVLGATMLPHRQSAQAATPQQSARAATQAAVHAARFGTALACDGHTAPGAPVTITPALGPREQPTTVRGRLLLDHCVSPNHSVRGIRSGTVTFNLSGTASCTSARDVSGSGRVTWYATEDWTGRPVGASALGARGPRSWAPGMGLPTIVIRSGPLAGRVIDAGPVGTPRMLQCSTRGIHSLSGAFWARAR